MGAPKTPTPTPTPKGNSDKKERKKRRNESFSTYIFKVLKQVHQDTGITKTSMSIMNSFIKDLFERICLESSKLARMKKKQTLTPREIQSSIKLILPGELARHAILEGNKAINNTAQSQSG